MLDRTHGQFELLTADDGKTYMCCLLGIDVGALGGGNIKFLVNGRVKSQFVQDIQQMIEFENCTSIEQLEARIATDVGEYVNGWGLYR